jgi:hypothetical protein
MLLQGGGFGEDLLTPFRVHSLTGASAPPLSRSASKAAALAEEDMEQAEVGDAASHAHGGVAASTAAHAAGRLNPGALGGRLPSRGVHNTAHGEQERRSLAALMLTLPPEVRAELSHMGGSIALVELASGHPGFALPTATGGAIPSFVWGKGPQLGAGADGTAHYPGVPVSAPLGDRGSSPAAGPRPSADLGCITQPEVQGSSHAAPGDLGHSHQPQLASNTPGSLPAQSPQAGHAVPGQQQPGQGPGNLGASAVSTGHASGSGPQLLPSRSLPPLRASNPRGLTATAVLGTLSKAPSLRAQTTTGAVTTESPRVGPLTTTLHTAFSDASQQLKVEGNSQQSSIDGTHRDADLSPAPRQGIPRSDDTALHPQRMGLAATAAGAKKDTQRPKEAQVSWHLGSGSIRAHEGGVSGWTAPLWWRRLRMECWRLQSKNSFSMFLIGIIMINAIFLGLQW